MAILSLNDNDYHGDNIDLIIVGAGAVGITMAVAFARQGLRVTLLEAGPRHPPGNFATANRGPTAGRTLTRMETGRMRAYGGTTRLWGGQLAPFDQDDLESTDETGKRLWPINYEELSPWLDTAFELLGIDSGARDTKTIYRRACRSNGSLGHGLETLLTIWLPQPDFTRLFSQDLEQNPLITVLTDAEVRRLQFDNSGQVRALEIGNEGGRKLTIHPRTVILAAGTFEIARLMLRSQAVDPACPFRENSNVGRWFMDHLHGCGGEIDVADKKKVANLFDSIFFQGRKYLPKVSYEGRSHAQSANMAVVFMSRFTIRELLADAQQLFRRMIGRKGTLRTSILDAIGIARTIIPFAWRYLVSGRAGFVGKSMPIGFEIEQLPHRDSYFFLDPAYPPETAPVGVHWTVGGQEMPSVQRFCQALVDSAANQGLGNVRLDPRALAGDPAFLESFHNSSHYMGGARMAHDADQGVVDSNCRVFGSANLYIAGAAVFPTGSFANSTLTAIALGQRLAAHLSKARLEQPAAGSADAGTGRFPGPESSNAGQEYRPRVDA